MSGLWGRRAEPSACTHSWWDVPVATPRTRAVHPSLLMAVGVVSPAVPHLCCLWGMQLARVKAGLTGMAKAQFDVLRATHHLDHLNPTTTTTTCSSPAHAAASSTFATPSSYTHSSVSAAAQRAMESNQVSNFNRSSHL